MTDIDLDAFFDVLEEKGRPLVTASDVAAALDVTQADAEDALEVLAVSGRVESLSVDADPRVWFPVDWKDQTDRERVVLFPKRREIVVDHAEQFTRAQLSQFAHVIETNRHGGAAYEIRPEDVWLAPYDDVDDLLGTVRQVVGRREPRFEEWVEGQWARARKFRLYTHEDGYVVLSASSPDLLGNIAMQQLDDHQLRARISDTEAWVASGEAASVKRTLYDAGYPVQDHRTLEPGADLDISVTVALREYQNAWVDRFVEKHSGVLVGPPGSGKTVAAMGVMAALGGETLVLVPTRELAAQWKKELLARTSLTDDQVGEYHGGTKELRPVTIATYQTAGMDRHRVLFEERHWGLVVYDEVHHVTAPIFKRTVDLQSKARLGLSATPVREDDNEADIFTLIGPPIGTDWGALFDAGFVAEPEVEIRYVPFDDAFADEYGSTSGHDRRQVAARNPAKIDEITAILRSNPGASALVFVEYLDHGDEIAAALDVPFVSGQTPHPTRARLFREFRNGDRDVLVVSRIGDEGIDLPNAELAITASGLGGSRRQGAQRAGRTMRPVGNARVVVLATRGTEEEDFARNQMRHLASKGIQVTERDGTRRRTGRH